MEILEQLKVIIEQLGILQFASIQTMQVTICFFVAGYDYDFDVIIDDLGETIEICKKIAAQYGDVVWQQK